MTAELSHDEQYYVSSGVALKDSRLYKDIAYTQTPVMPWIYRAVLAVTGEGDVLFWARSVCCFFFILSVVALFFIVSFLVNKPAVAWGLTAFYTANSVVQFTTGYSWNHFPALAFFLLALACFVRALKGGGKSFQLFFVAGILSGLAVSVKLFYLPFIPVLFLGSVWLFDSTRYVSGRVRAGLFFLLGTMLGLLPSMIYLVLYQQEFIFFTYVYHQLTVFWYDQKGFAAYMLLVSRLHFLKRLFLQDIGNAALLGLTVLSGLAAGYGVWRNDRSRGQVGRVIFFKILLLVAVIIILIPKPLFTQYVLILVPLMIAFAAASFELWTASTKRIGEIIILCAGIAFCMSFIWSGTKGFIALASPQEWTSARMQGVAHKIAQFVPVGGRVVSFAPLFVIEAGRPIYRVLASGPFLYRVADYLSLKDQRLLGAVGSSSLIDLLEADPPQAVLTGFEPEIDGVLESFAYDHGFREVTGQLPEGRLFIR